jgi:hypothetical protein
MAAPAAALARLAASGRPRAFGIHLALSLAAVGALAALMHALWYPPPYFLHDGGWRVLRIIVLVDVVVGPLLTFVVFDRAKPELRRDLAVIAALQCVAFVWGTWVMFQNRPAFVVFTQNAFQTVSWHDVQAAGAGVPQARALAAGLSTPAMVVLQWPADPRERLALIDAARTGRASMAHRADLYRPLDAAAFESIVRGATPIEDLARGDASIAAELARVRAAHPGIRLAFVPVECRDGIIMLVFDHASRAVIDWMT